jgi:hypothetical protein
MDEEEFYAWLESMAPEEQEQALYDFGFMSANDMPGMYGDMGGAGMLPELGYGEFDVGTYSQLPPELNKKGEVMPWGLDQEAQAYNALQDLGSMTMDNALAMYGGPGAYDVSAFEPISVPMGAPLDMSDARYLDALAESGAGYESYLAKAIRDKNMTPGQAVADLMNFISMGGEDEVDPGTAEIRQQLIDSLPTADTGDPASMTPSARGRLGDLTSPEGRAATTNMAKIEALASDLFERKTKIPEPGYVDPETGLPFAAAKTKPSPAAEKYMKAGIPTPNETYMDEEWLNAPLDPAELEAQLLAEDEAQAGYAGAIENVNAIDADVSDLEQQMREWERLSLAGPQRTGEAGNPWGLGEQDMEAANRLAETEFERLQRDRVGAGATTTAQPTGGTQAWTGAGWTDVQPESSPEWERARLLGQAMETQAGEALNRQQPYVRTRGDEVASLFDFGQEGEDERTTAGANALMGKIYDFLPGGREGYDVERLDRGLLNKARGGRRTSRDARQRALDEQIRVHERTSGSEVDRASAIGRAIAMQRAGRTPTNDILMQRALARRTLMGR